MNTLLTILLTVMSFAAQFVQQKTSAMFAEPQRSEGQLIYRSPDYLRWEYTKPQPLVWELDGDKGNMNPHIKSMVILIRQSVSGDFSAAQKSFKVEQQDNTVILTPVKRELKNLFKQIRIVLNPDTQIADEVTICEANGDVTTIHFFAIRWL